ncbi:hypothetical protein [Zooshikella ganghwensis]|uniref:hypothetical protein n=1 Tax=Zooshikella ganghwensis TaxID=202772 RepID=UPI0003F827DC|nr:hypothetical protein [Zooshikella ganghwensis]
MTKYPVIIPKGLTHLRSWLTGLITGLSLSFHATAGKPEALVLMAECPAHLSECVTMSLNLGSVDWEDYIEREIMLTPSYTLVSFPVRGTLANDNKTKRYHVAKAIFTQGLGCSDLDHVAVVGYSTEGDPILLTKKGEFTVKDIRLSIGCEQCLQLIDDNLNLIAEYTTPAWDLSLVDLEPKNLTWNQEGALFIQHHGNCLRWHKNNHFQQVDNTYCKPSPDLKPMHPSQMDEPPTLKLIVPQSPLQGLLQAGACT